MPKRRTLSDARAELRRKCSERDRKLAACIECYVDVFTDGRGTEKEAMESENYQTLLAADKESVSRLENEVEQLERLEEERIQKKKMRLTKYNSNDSKRDNLPRYDSMIVDDADDGPADNALDKEGEDDEEEDELKEELIKQAARVEKSKLYVALQGLGMKASGSTAVEGNHDDPDHDENISETPEEDMTSLEYNGRVFHRNQCYHYKSSGMEVIVGISKFIPKSNAASIVLVVPYTETFLGVDDEGIEFKSTWQPSEFVQVEEKLDLVYLGNLGDECQAVKTLPAIVYKAQDKGDMLHFAYYYIGKRSRRGRRNGGCRVLDLFSGAGGMSQGFHRAGLETSWAVELDATAASSFEKNFSGAVVENKDVSKFLDECEGDKKYKDCIGRMHHVHASSPCQGFSGANVFGGIHDTKNNELSKEFVRAVAIFKPVTATFENVLGMWKREHQPYLREIMQSLLRLGYQVRCCQLNAIEFGDPQARPRLFIFAAKQCAYLPARPKAEHGKGTIMDLVTVEDALKSLSSSQKHSENNNEYHPERLRLSQTTPAKTIRASKDFPIHYKYNRPITMDEMKALFSLPPEFVLEGSERKQRKQLGNSVPAGMGEAVGCAVRAVLEYVYEEEESDGH